jgi:sugar O-acyltransferase (sialic acid O-acetyltransferase NeuD family)
LQSAADKAGVPFCGDSEGGMFGFFLFPELPQNYAKVMTTDNKRFNALFHGMLERGVYFAPALYEAGFMSAAHTEADIAFTVDAAFLPEGGVFCGLPVVPFETVEAAYPAADHSMFVAVGYNQVNKARALKVEAAKAKGYRLASYISSRASVLTKEPIGENAFILEDNTIQPFVQIGNDVVLWSGNHIGHHSVIGDHCFITSHVVVSGRVTVGDYCFIGVNATIRNAVTIGRGCVIGMGACILADCEPDGLYAATGTERARIPASKLRKL